MSDQNNISFTDEHEILQTVTFMKNKTININADREAIVSAMQSTYTYRRNLILSTLAPITEILQTFPKFIHMPYLVIILIMF